MAANEFGFVGIEEEEVSQEPKSTQNFGFIPEKEESKFVRDVKTGTKEAAKGLGRIAGRGTSSLLAAPSKGIGGFLEFLGRLYPEEEEDRLASRAIKNAGRFFRETGESGQAFLNNLIEKNLGESFSKPEEALTRFTERVADIYGRGPFKGMGAASVAGGALGQIGEELGAPENVQSLLELAGMGAPNLSKAAQSLAKTAVAEKSGLVLPKIVEKTENGFKFIKPKVFAGKKDEVYKEVSDQANKLIKDIRSKSLPLSEEIEKGIDVEARLSSQLSDIEKIAEKLPEKIESKFVSDYLNKVEEKIKSAPVPTTEQEQILKLTKKFKKQYGELAGGVRFFSPSQYTRQFRNINKDAKKLYETQLLQGKQLETIGFYEGLKNEITKTIEHGTPTAFSNLFKETNKEYSQFSKLNQFDALMETVTKDGVLDSSKLSNIFKNPSKSKKLQRQLGEEGFKNLKNISNDLSLVKDKLNLIEEYGLNKIVRSAVATGILTKLGVPFAKPFQLGKKVADLSRGYMLLNPKGVRDTENLLKALRSGNKKMIESTLRNLDKHAKEFEDEELPELEF